MADLRLCDFALSLKVSAWSSLHYYITGSMVMDLVWSLRYGCHHCRCVCVPLSAGSLPLPPVAAGWGGREGWVCCSCGDTWASEVGSVLGGAPRLFTTWQRVPQGTNEGITGVGILCSIAGDLVVGMACFVTLDVFLDVGRFGNVIITSMVIFRVMVHPQPTATPQQNFGSLPHSIIYKASSTP